MFTHNLDSTASYRTVARGVGCGFTRAYQESQQARMNSRARQALRAETGQAFRRAEPGRANRCH